MKPDASPEILRVHGQRRRNAHCTSYTRYTAEYQNGTRTFPFDSEIYGHPEIKQALVAAQHGKCCFCERRVGADGDVEHFRPKAACRQDETCVLTRPGYYWLAYAWENLMLSCSACNQRHKKNLFPLADPAGRATSH